MGVSLDSLPLHKLRGIDIRTPDEEKIVQELVNKRLQNTPVYVEINRPSDKTDFKTLEQEMEFQKVIDERVASSKPQIQADDPKPVGDPPEPTPPIQLAKFCTFCSAKGPISHLKTCTRPEKSLKDKINALKVEKAKIE